MTDTPKRWSMLKLGTVLYPFVMGAVAINLFFLGLIARSAGWPALSISPIAALIWSLPLGIPASWAAARWVRHLIDTAES